MEGFMSSSTPSSFKKKQDQEETQGDDHDLQEDHDESLKARISSHPLYGLLVQTHLECLKIGGIGDESADETDTVKDYMKQLDNHKPSTLEDSELDRFMEAYCLALGKLKEAMEEPQKKSMSFIASMHLQLKEITTMSDDLDDLDDLDEPDSPASSCHQHQTSGET